VRHLWNAARRAGFFPVKTAFFSQEKKLKNFSEKQQKRREKVLTKNFGNDTIIKLSILDSAYKGV